MNAAIGDIMGRFTTQIIDPAIYVVVALGFFLFVYGLVEFLWAIRHGSSTTEGKQHMLWGVIGMTIMISVGGIINLINNTFSLGINQTSSGSATYNPNVNQNGVFNQGFFKSQ